jgi:flagellar export protein FliJ
MSQSTALFRRLDVLQRLHELELQEARGAHAAAEKRLQQQQRRIAALESKIAETQALAQERVTRDEGVSVDVMHGLRVYEAWQAQLLRSQHRALKAEEEATEQAREQVIERFKRLHVIERLDQRHRRNEHERRMRDERNALDEAAMIVAGHRREPGNQE